MQAMESGVKEVRLSDGVTLDMETLSKYSGQGQCRRVTLGNYKGTTYKDREELKVWNRYKKKLKSWARSKKWRIYKDDEWGFTICE